MCSGSKSYQNALKALWHSALSLLMCTTGGIFHSTWTKCTTSNTVSLIFVFLMGCLIFSFCNLIHHAGFFCGGYNYSAARATWEPRQSSVFYYNLLDYVLRLRGSGDVPGMRYWRFSRVYDDCCTQTSGFNIRGWVSELIINQMIYEIYVDQNTKMYFTKLPTKQTDSKDCQVATGNDFE